MTDNSTIGMNWQLKLLSFVYKQGARSIYLYEIMWNQGKLHVPYYLVTHPKTLKERKT